jgi:hypothetical protein
MHGRRICMTCPSSSIALKGFEDLLFSSNGHDSGSLELLALVSLSGPLLTPELVSLMDFSTFDDNAEEKDLEIGIFQVGM